MNKPVHKSITVVSGALAMLMQLLISIDVLPADVQVPGDQMIASIVNTVQAGFGIFAIYGARRAIGPKA